MTQEEKTLLKLLSLFTFSTATANTFLGIFLFTYGGFQTVALFFSAYYFFLVLAYNLSGLTLKKISSSQAIQIGLLLYSFSYFLLVILGKDAIHYLTLLSAVFGFASGTYWSGNNLSQYIVTNEETRNEYFSKLSSFSSIATMIGPLLGGTIISIFTSFHLNVLGYTFLFTFVGACLIATAAIARKLPYHSSISFSFKDLFFRHSTSIWKLVLLQQFLVGLYDAAFSTLSGIIVFFILKSEFSVGVINALSSIANALISFYAGRVLRKYNHAYILGMFFTSIGLLIFGYFHNTESLLSLIFLIFGLSSFLITPVGKTLYDVIDNIPGGWKEKYHFLVERDTALGIGRSLTYAVLLFFLTSQKDISVVTTWVICIAGIPASVALVQFDITVKMNAQKSEDFEVATKKVWA